MKADIVPCIALLVPLDLVLLNVFVPPGSKFEQKVPPKKRVIATKLNLQQKCVNHFFSSFLFVFLSFSWFFFVFVCFSSFFIKTFSGATYSNTMFTKKGSKWWSLAPDMKTSFSKSDLKFLRIDSNSFLKFWRNLMVCLRKRFPKSEVLPLLWTPIFEVLT